MVVGIARGLLALVLLLGGCSKGNKNDAPRQENAKTTAAKPATVDPATPDPATPTQKPAALRLGGERTKVSDVSGPLALLPPVDFAPKLSDKPTKAELEARYALATKHVAKGEEKKALALLHGLLTLKNCSDCARLVNRVTDDSAWEPLYGSPILFAVIDAWVPPPFTCPTGPKEDGCPAGTTRKGKGFDSDNGESFCEKPGGIKHGPHLEWGTDPDDGGHENGWSNKECFVDGKRNGESTENGAFESIRDYYIDDKIVGVTENDVQSSAHVVRSLKFAGDLSVFWRQNKDPEVLVGFEMFRAGKPHGEQLRWHVTEDGYRTLIHRKTYKNGVLHGPQVEYSDTTGQALSLIPYVDGVIHGKVEYWDKDGKALGSTEIKRGDGPWIRYEEGKLVETGTLLAGKKHGLWTEPKDFLEHVGGTGFYMAGVRDGQWTLGGPDAQYTGAYKAGKRHGLWTYYNNEREVWARGELSDGEPVGTWKVTLYDPDIAERRESTFQFRRGVLLSIDGKKYPAKKYGFNGPTTFADDPRMPDEL